VMPYLRTRTAVALGLTVIDAGTAAGVIAETVNKRCIRPKPAPAATGGAPSRGEAMFIQYGCGSCHGVKHVRKASGAVGPSLDGVAVRAMIAGRLDNTPANLQAWIRDPQHISPGTAMPDLNVGEQ